MAVSVVSGVPGVGSSNVCQEARSRLDDSYQLVNFGDVMLEEAVSRGLAAAREELGRLPVRDYRLLQRSASEFIAERTRDNELIVDTHFMLHTNHGFLPGFPEDVLREVRPDRLVLVEAAPSTIVDRRSGSEYRDYGGQDERLVEFHQQLNRAAAVTYSMHTGAPIRVLSNESTPDETAETLVRMVAMVE